MVRRVLLGGWLVILAGVTSQQVRVWESEQSLWTQAVAWAPLKPRPHLNLGRAFDVSGGTERAEREYLLTTSLAMNPRREPRMQLFARVAAETNLAHLRMQRGQWATAMRILDQVLVEWPNFPYAAYNRAIILAVAGACQAAGESYQMARAFPMIVFPAPAPCVETE